jgi:hypothetical protein
MTEVKSRGQFLGYLKEKPLAFSTLTDEVFSIGEIINIITHMNILLILVVLLLLFGGGGFYFGGPVVGGSGLGLVLLICLIVFLMGGFRTTKS